jgi:hypothetical protein
LNPDNLHAKLVEKGTEAARTRAYAATCDRIRKQTRAKWVVHHCGSNTLGKAESLALLEDEYIKSCVAAERAEEEAGVAAVEYQAAQAWLEVWRTMEATKRAEMNIR